MFSLVKDSFSSVVTNIIEDAAKYKNIEIEIMASSVLRRNCFCYIFTSIVRFRALQVLDYPGKAPDPNVFERFRMPHAFYSMNIDAFCMYAALLDVCCMHSMLSDASCMYLKLLHAS